MLMKSMKIAPQGKPFVVHRKVFQSEWNLLSVRFQAEVSKTTFTYVRRGCSEAHFMTARRSMKDICGSLYCELDSKNIKSFSFYCAFNVYFSLRLTY